MKLINKTKLTYKEIGGVMDEYINNSYGDTFYVGKVEYFKFIYRGNAYKCQISYMKSDVKWVFTELDNSTKLGGLK